MNRSKLMQNLPTSLGRVLYGRYDTPWVIKVATATEAPVTGALLLVNSGTRRACWRGELPPRRLRKTYHRDVATFVSLVLSEAIFEGTPLVAIWDQLDSGASPATDIFAEGVLLQNRHDILLGVLRGGAN